MGNYIKKVHAKWLQASSIRSGRKVGGTKSRKKEEEERKKKKEDTFSGSKMANFKQS